MHNSGPVTEQPQAPCRATAGARDEAFVAPLLHRCCTDPAAMAGSPLDGYPGLATTEVPVSAPRYPLSALPDAHSSLRALESSQSTKEQIVFGLSSSSPHVPGDEIWNGFRLHMKPQQFGILLKHFAICLPCT